MSSIKPAIAVAASTTETKATVKFTKTKATGFKSIIGVYADENYLIALGTKSSGYVISYSADGTSFKDINLTSAVKKAYSKEKISSVKFSSNYYYINKRKVFCIIGTATTSDNTKLNYLVSVSSDMKKVDILKLDDAVKKLDSKASDITIDTYFDYDYKSGMILINGSYKDSSEVVTPIYLISKKNNNMNAYKTPHVNCNRVELAGDYLVCYNWFLNLTNEWSDTNKGVFFYSKNYESWSKAETPSVDNALGWNRAYYDWEGFGAAPQNNNSNTHTVYYTKDMKNYKTVSKDYVLDTSNKWMHIFKYDNKMFAEEHGNGDKRQFVFSEFSTKTGNKWKQLANYTAKSDDFKYMNNTWIAGGFLLVNDGNIKKLFKYSNGKEYTTSLSTDKLSLYSDYKGCSYGVYDKQYLLGSKTGLVKNYLFKTPVKIKNMTMWSGKKTANRIYVYSDNAIYYVNEATVNKAIK